MILPICYLLGTFIECKYPYPRKVSEFEEYHEVTCHFLYGEDDSDEEESRTGYSVSQFHNIVYDQFTGCIQGGLHQKTRWYY